MNNFFKKLHLWVSVPFGVVITITCFTGALLVFETEITELCYRPIMEVEADGTPLSLDELMVKVEPALEDGARVTGVVVSSDPELAYKFNLSKPKRSALYVDQYTGEVKGMYGRLPFFNVVRRLHRWLMDTRPEGDGIYWGKMIVGASTLAFVVILLTGVVIWWPRNSKMLRNRLRIAVGKGWNRFWYDLHVAGGFYVLLLLLVMSLTGLTWSFEWYRNGFYSVLGVEMSQDDSLKRENNAVKTDNVAQNKVEAGSVDVDSIKVETFGEAVSLADAVSPATTQADAVSSATVQADATSGATQLAQKTGPAACMQKALESVVAKNPDYETITLSGAVASVAQKGPGNKRAYDRFTFDENTGEIISEELYASASLRTKATGWVRTIHVGSWGGVFSKTLYFLAALLGATLPLTGYYFWIRRLYMKRKSKK